MRTAYAIIWTIVWPFFSLFHPCRCIGREHIPEGGALFCANHTRLSDPVCLVMAVGRKHQMRVMAKAEFMRAPILGFLLKKAGVFAVERGKSDVGAIKTAIKFLKSGENVLLFPEGTRVRDGEEGEAKTGAAMLAVRTGVPIVPVYIPARKPWFRFTDVVIGEPYYPQVEGRKGTAEEYKAIAEDLMERIYALGKAA
ncbi:lysophospholipid acyltransferase family protein [Lawsonibacter faecis]|uniref:1-acyl-sn-glycerol-3-phosphate acyltransferase n=1 Tax=Lawsonibacter faecis TaxID=2763052 RepID=A0A8J6JPI7_9FIRM|nr:MULTISPECIES: lysophospholipid acyltransferase family protein [Oscillospiraceae]MTQ97403.1 1-acyl-sn-glycerol-3-phosphate acyltransferase [Pseudoflavonifractor sp. BIOML-A16]MTR06433.1 1-acyl-sn-glycerol-3-phosphate acyltransferase [Pseudoflavonifractor sp. BIOML-A15]MTR31708.1 1-acyl-sn-glycerol-3-phosphate acyltransferase [Pseudoflavonifractor sp. BIOML-A14]MTR72394.1 1-acyl-sn-glycerol-3-phosphate acyltransferase [Pseudoflavonifractor sp. BIOML-A18]MTS64280.1 1-acyl-sn-glycerol-3-phospha